MKISTDKIIIWPERKTVEKALALKPDVLLYNVSEVDTLLAKKLELLEIYDENEKKIGLASRKATHSLHLTDRVAHVFVFNSEGKLFLQQRMKNKDVYPRYFALSASGHLDPGESPSEAAVRELEEEIGVKKSKVKFLGKFKCFTPVMNEFVYVFMCVTDQPIKINRKEVLKAKFYSTRELKKLNRKLFIPALKKELKLYWNKMQKDLPKIA